MAAAFWIDRLIILVHRLGSSSPAEESHGLVPPARLLWLPGSLVALAVRQSLSSDNQHFAATARTPNNTTQLLGQDRQQPTAPFPTIGTGRWFVRRKAARSGKSSRTLVLPYSLPPDDSTTRPSCILLPGTYGCPAVEEQHLQSIRSIQDVSEMRNSLSE